MQWGQVPRGFSVAVPQGCLQMWGTCGPGFLLAPRKSWMSLESQFPLSVKGWAWRALRFSPTSGSGGFWVLGASSFFLPPRCPMVLLVLEDHSPGSTAG